MLQHVCELRLRDQRHTAGKIVTYPEASKQSVVQYVSLRWSVISAVEYFLDMEKVASSILAPTTKFQESGQDGNAADC